MKKLGFIGGGNMAEALLRGLLKRRVLARSDLIVSDPASARRRKLARGLGIETIADNRRLVRESRAVVLAVKPQAIDAVLAELAGDNGKRRAGARVRSNAKTPARQRVFISIAAGITIARLERGLGPRARVIRVMPNAPAMVGHGMAAMVLAKNARPADEAFALRIFRAVGEAVALRDERMLDVVTALSGSGPAYVYLFIKSLADAAASQGLPGALALRMALQTVRGAEVNLRGSTHTPAQLIRIVASPGGTTEAALRRFAEAGFSDIVARALHAAAQRSRELGRIG